MFKYTILSIIVLIRIIFYGSASPLPQNSTTISSTSTTPSISSNDDELTSLFADLINKFSISSSKKSELMDYIRLSKFSHSLNLKSFSEKINEIQENSPNSSVLIDCDLKFKKALKNSKVFSYKNCDPEKILVNENFTKIFDIFPSAFLVSFEVQGSLGGVKEDEKDKINQSIDTKVNFTLNREFGYFSSVEVRNIQQNFENFHQSILVLIYENNNKTKTQNSSDSDEILNNKQKSSNNPENYPKYSTYLIENSHLTHLTYSNDKKFSLGNFIASLDSKITNSSIIDFSDKITESLTNNCPICLRTLQLLNLKNYLLNLEIPNGNQLKKFHCDIDCFRALLITPTNFNFTNIPEHISILLHEKFINALRMKTSDVISMNENTTIDEFIESHSVTMELEGLTTLALLQKQFKVLEFLVRADCPYPANFTTYKVNSRLYPMKNRFVKKLEKHKEIIEKFHSDIKDGDIKAVEMFLKKNNYIKFARDEENKSALKVAFENEQLEIYAMMKSHGMVMSSLKEIVEKFKKISDLEEPKKNLIRHSNFQFLTSAAHDPANYIDKLVQKSKFNFDLSQFTKDKIISEIRRAFIDVNETTPEILEICSKSEDLVIIFDFDYAIIDEFEPGSSAVGLAQRQYDYVVIAANEFLSLDKDERNYALGTLSHELMHYAMYLVYDNDANPYLKDDMVTKNLFRNFTEKCKKFERTEPHLAYPDNTEPDDFHIELIARVPDTLLIRKNQQILLDIIKYKFSELFDFYYEKILQDMRDMTATMSDREKVREINQWLDLVPEIERFEIEIIVKDAEVDCSKIEKKKVVMGNEEVSDEEDTNNQIEGSRDDVNLTITTLRYEDEVADNEVQKEEDSKNSSNILNNNSNQNHKIEENSQEIDDYFEDDDDKNVLGYNQNDTQNHEETEQSIQNTTKIQEITTTAKPQTSRTTKSETTTSSSSQATTTTFNPNANTIPQNPQLRDDENTQDNNIPIFIQTTTKPKFPTDDEDYLGSGSLEDTEELRTHENSNYDDDYDDENNSNYFKKRKAVNGRRILKRSSGLKEVDVIGSLKRTDHVVEGFEKTYGSKRLQEADVIPNKVDRVVKGLDNTFGNKRTQKSDAVPNKTNHEVKDNTFGSKRAQKDEPTPRKVANNNNSKVQNKSNQKSFKPSKRQTNLQRTNSIRKRISTLKLYKRSTDFLSNITNTQNTKILQNSTNSTAIPTLDTFITNLGFEFTSNHSNHIIFSNFPKAILKFIHKMVTNRRQIGVFMKLSARHLDNFHKIINDLSNLKSEVLMVIYCNEIDYLPGFVETINSYSFKHVLYVADDKNFGDFESYEEGMEMREFSVLWDDLCPKSQNFLTKFTFYFQNDEVLLKDIIGNNKSVMSQFGMERIYEQDDYSIAADSVPENVEFYVDRRLIDEDGRVWGLNRLVNDLFELKDEEGDAENEEVGESGDDVRQKVYRSEHGSKMLREQKKYKSADDNHILDINLNNYQKYSENFKNSPKNLQKLTKSSQKFQKYQNNPAVPFEVIQSSKFNKNTSKLSIMKKHAQKPHKNSTKIPKSAKFIIESQQEQNSSPKSSNSQEFQKIFKNPRNSTTFILTSPPGSGKSTTLKEIASKIREISPTLWVAYVNLTVIDLVSNFTSEDIHKYLIENVLKLSELDVVVFNHLFAEQRVVFLFDEFDKIDGKSKKNSVKIFKYCESQSATIWISTRPRNLEFFQNNLESTKIFKLSELSKSDTEKFLEFFDESREAEIMKFLESIGRIGNPRMIHEIAEIFESQENISNFYSIFSQLVLNRNFEKSTKNLEFNDIEDALSSPQKLLKAHQLEALKHFYPSEFIKILNVTTESIENLENYELIYKNSQNETKFIHESFASYFVAQYFAENLLKSQNNYENNKKLFIESKKFKSWKIIAKFLSDYIKVNDDKLDFERVNETNVILNKIDVF